MSTIALEKRLQAELESLDAERAEIAKDLALLRGTSTEQLAVSLPAFLGESGDEVQFIFGGLIPACGIGLMVADGFVGKSSLLVQICAALASGRSTLGFRVAKQRPVLMVQAEGSRPAFRARVRTCVKSMGLDPHATDWFIQPEKMTDFRIGSEGLEIAIRSSKAELVVLDTLGYFFKGDENSATEWKQGVMSPLRGLAARYGCAFVLVHHHSKVADREGWRKGRGSTAMFDDADFWMRLEPVEGKPDQRDLFIDKNKYGRTDHVPLVYDGAGAVFREREG